VQAQLACGSAPSASAPVNAMSWQPYVDHAVASGMATKGGIYDLQGNAWAFSKGFFAIPAEIAAVAEYFPHPEGMKSKGATIAGVRYGYASGERNKEIYLRNRDSGVVLCKCATCIVVAQHAGDLLPYTCIAAIRKICEYLRRGEEEAVAQSRQAAQAWQPYIDHAVASGIVTLGGIFDLQGNACAISAGWGIKPHEISAITPYFGNAAALQGKGHTIAGTRYTFADAMLGNEIYFRREATGVVFFKCASAIVIGYHDADLMASTCRAAVRRLADRYLKGS